MADADLNRNMPGERGNAFSVPGKMQRLGLAWRCVSSAQFCSQCFAQQKGGPLPEQDNAHSVGVCLLPVLVGFRDALAGGTEGLALESGFIYFFGCLRSFAGCLHHRALLLWWSSPDKLEPKSRASG